MSNDSEPTSRSLSVPRGQSLALRPGNALVTRGLQDIAQFGSRARAKEEHDEAIQPAPSFLEAASAHYNRGLTYAKVGDYNHAVADYTEALRILPQFVAAFCSRGAAYSKMGDYDRAISDYAQAIRIAPDDADAYYDRGLAYEEKGDLAKADLDFAEANRLGYKP